MDTNMNNTDIDRSDRVLDLSDVAADSGGSGIKSEGESEVGSWRSLFGDKAAVTSALPAGDDEDEQVEQATADEEESEDDEVEEPAQSAAEAPKKKQKHPPMFAEEQIATIAALQGKLSEFPAPQPKPSSSVSPKKKRAKQKPVDSAAPTSPESVELEQTTGKKRKRISKPKTKSPKQPRPQKRSRKSSTAELKQPTVTVTAQALINMLAKLDPSSTTVKDVQNIVDKAGEILDDKPSGATFDEEIRALLAQEDGWKEMARQADVGLKEDVKKFMERYGIIPIGALEAAKSKAMDA